MGKDEIKRQVETATKKAEAKKINGTAWKNRLQSKSARSFPFKAEKVQVWHQVESETGDGTTRKRWVAFSSEINVLALTRNEDGQEWGRLLEIVDPDGNRHLWAMPLSLTAGSGEGLRVELLGLGLELMPGRKPKEWLLEYRLTRCVKVSGVTTA